MARGIRPAWDWVKAHKVKTGLGAAGVLGAGAFGYNALFGDDPAPLPTTDLSALGNYYNNTNEQYRKDYLAMLGNREQQQLAMIDELYGGGDPYAQPARQNLNDYLGTMNNYASAKGTGLEQYWNQTANRIAGEGANAGNAADAAASSVSDIYSRAGGRVARNARSNNGSMTSGLTPVSGGLADAPANLRRQGASLRDYIGRVGNIDRADLDYAAETAREQGAGYSTELRDQAALLGAQQRFALNQQLAERAAAREEAYAQAKMGIAQNTADAQTQFELGSPPPAIDMQTAMTLAATWDTLNDVDKGNLSSIGITNGGEYAVFLLTGRTPKQMAAQQQGLPPGAIIN